MLIIQHRLVAVMPRGFFRYSTQVHGWGLQRQGALLIMLWQIFSQPIRYLCAMAIAGESGPALDKIMRIPKHPRGPINRDWKSTTPRLRRLEMHYATSPLCLACG